jgi:hypothetical protein
MSTGSYQAGYTMSTGSYQAGYTMSTGSYQAGYTMSTGSYQVFSDSLTLKMKTRRYFEDIYQLTRRHIPEDFSLHQHRCENFKTRTKPFYIYECVPF